jgi:hypothetical protein
MPTPKLPFYEKDAQRWMDAFVAMAYELADIRRCCNIPSIGHRIDDQVQQCKNMAFDIKETLDEKRQKTK